MSDILFGQSYFLRFDPKLWAAMQPYPPLGTLYAASFLRARGYEVALFDAMLAESEAEWEAALAREQPRFAVIYEDNFNYLSKMCLLRMREAAFTMIGMARARGCTVILCGSDATDHAELYLQQGADFVLLGEGEATLGELMDRLTGRTDVPFEEILGLAWRVGELGELGEGVRGRQGDKETRRQGDRETKRQGDKETISNLQSPIPNTQYLISNTQISNLQSPISTTFHRTARRRDIKELDALPFPAWDLVDVERYRALWLEHHGYYSMNMVTTRGCPYHCNWCAKPIWGQRYNVRSADNVVAELKWLREHFQPDHIWFADDIVGLKPGWWARFADRVEAEGVRTPFKCLSRVDLLLRDDDIPALKRAGCDIVWVGAESGAQTVLDAMEKGTKVEQIYAAAQRLHEAGVRVGFFLQFGYPGETREAIEQTLQMVRDCAPDDIGMSVSYPLPGTTFHTRVKSQLGAKQNWRDSNDLAMLYEGPFSTDFYRHLHTVLHKEYRARKSWREARRVLRQPWQLRPSHLRQFAAMAYHALTLPLARRTLDQLETQSPNALRTLLPAMDHEAAATPSPQR